MPSVLSRLQQFVTPQKTAAFSTAVILYYFFLRFARRKRTYGARDLHIKLSDAQKNEKAAVNMEFFGRLYSLFKVLVPGFCSPEAGYMCLVALSLVARTYCDVWMIQNGTAIESAIIGRNLSLFKQHLFRFICAMPSISLLNNLLKLGLSELKLRFRTRLSVFLYDKYLRGFTYYQMTNLDNRICNADQLLTTDVEKFCDCVAELYSNLSKPILDIFIYAIKLTHTIGAQGPGYMFLYLIFSGLVLTHLRRPVGRMTMTEQQIEGEYRFVNSRLITNSEEIAFYHGNVKEISIMHATFTKLVDHLRSLIGFRFRMGILDNVIAKYVATVVGYMVVSRPFLNLANPQFSTSSHSQLLEEYYKSGRMLVRMAEAIGRVVLAGREMTRLSGFTARIVQLNRVLDDLNRGRYVRTMVDNGGRGLPAAGSGAQKLQGPAGEGDISDYELVNQHRRLAGSALVPGTGKIIHQDHLIRFEHVPLVTPNGDVLVEELNFEVRSGQNVIVCGPNGCGKSSLFRILGGLWPLFGGTLIKPPQAKLFYIPQRPYMTLGSLRDQVIYPDTYDLMRCRGVTDEMLNDYMDRVQLSYILDREGGWDSVQDWMDVLSGGEKQRIAMARLFYHRPQFAILDECTSAVSVDVEGAIYTYSRQVNITLFTVSHRKSLWRHHEYFLHMDGRGAFEFKPITEATDVFGS